MSYDAEGSGVLSLRLTDSDMRRQLKDALLNWYDACCRTELRQNDAYMQRRVQEVYHERIHRMKLYDDPFWWVQSALREVGFTEIDRDTETEDGIISMALSYDCDYRETEIMDLLNILSPFATEGRISYTGEEGDHWRLLLSHGNWVEQKGEIQFISEPVYPPFQRSQKALECLLAEIRRHVVCDRRDYSKEASALLDAFDHQDPDGVLLALTGRSLFEHGVAAGVWPNTGACGSSQERRV